MIVTAFMVAMVTAGRGRQKHVGGEIVVGRDPLEI
jgi:uncharacterized protein affecting Mg2+/Co2+ transport